MSLFRLTVVKAQPSKRGMAVGVYGACSCGICDQETERQMLLLLIQSGTQGHGTESLTCRMGLPSLVKPFWKHPPRYTQQFISRVLLNLIKVKRHDGLLHQPFLF